MAHDRLELQDRTVFLDEGVVRVESDEHALSDVEVRLLSWLARRRGTPVSRDELQVEVWGYTEGIVSRAVDSLVKRLRKKIEVEPGKPIYLVTVPGEGYAWQGPPLAQLAAARLPRYLDDSIGRESELTRAGELCATPGLISIVGPAGAGKTRLAATLAAREVDSGRQAWFAELADVTTAGDVVEAVLAAFGTRAESKNRQAQLAAVLSNSDGVLILDNVEQVVEVVSDLVDGWLQIAPSLRVVCTSRVQLQARGERVIRLGPLDLDDAVRLYVDRTASAWPELTLDATDPEIAELVHRLDCLPLAIELAASRAGVLGPRAMLDRLERGIGVLRGNVSLGDALHASWTLLEPEDRRAICQLAAFRGGFTLDAAEAVLSADLDAVDQIQSLARQSLIRIRATADGNRFDLYAAVRAYAIEREGEDPGALQRHATWAAREGERHAMAWLEHGRASALRWARSERLNLSAAWERVRREDPDLAARSLLAEEIGRAVVGPEDAERAARLREVVDTVTDPVLRARAVILLAARERNTGDIDGSMARLQALGPLEHPLLESERLANIALAHNHRGDVDLAETAWHASLDLQDTPRTHRHTQAMAQLASIRRSRGDIEGSREYRRKALALARTGADPSGVVWAATGLASISIGQGRIDEARGLLPEAVAASEHPECTVSRTVPMESQGLAAFEAGELDEAIEWLRRAADEAIRDGYVNVANARGLLGACLVERGEEEAGFALLREAAARYAGMGWRIYEGIHVGGTGMAHLLRGRPTAAIPELERALDLLGDDTTSEPVRLMLAVALARTGDGERARLELEAVPRELRESPSILWDLCAAAVLGEGAEAVLARARDPDAGPEPGRSWVRAHAYARWAVTLLEA